MYAIQEDYSVGTDAFLSAFEAEMFCCGGLDGHTGDVCAEDVGNGLAHLGDIGANLWLLGHDDAVDIADTIAFLLEEVVAVAQQQFAVDVFVSGVCVGEVFAYVAKGGGTEHGITDGMKQHVGVGMSQQTFGVGYFNAPQPQFAVVDKLVNIVS